MLGPDFITDIIVVCFLLFDLRSCDLQYVSTRINHALKQRTFFITLRSNRKKYGANEYYLGI